MSRRRLLVLVVAMGLLIGRQTQASDRMTATAYSAVSSPIIDGRLTDQCWSRSQVFGPFWLNNSGLAPKAATTAKVLYDKDNLYVAFDCQETENRALVATAKEKDGRCWEDDVVELFLQPPSLANFYHIMATSIGTVYDARGDNISWSSEARVAATKRNGGWTVEMSIPFRALGCTPKQGDLWRMNLCRERQSSPGEVTAWACPYGSFERTENFGQIIFGSEGPVTKAVEVGHPFWGANKAVVEIKNPLSHPMNLDVRAGVLGGKGAITKDLHLLPGQSMQIPFKYSLRSGNESAIYYSVVDKDKKTVFDYLVYDVNLTPSSNVSLMSGMMEGLQMTISGVGVSASLKQQVQSVLDKGRRSLREFNRACADAISAGKNLDPALWARFHDKNKLVIDDMRNMSYAVWAHDIWTPFAASDLPSMLDENVGLSLKCCSGEYEPTAFMISNLSGDILDARIVIGDLKPTDGGIVPIPSNFIAVHDVIFQKLRNGSIIPNELPLSNQIHRVQVPPGETRQVWMSLDSDKIVPGKYLGEVRIIPFNDRLPARTVKLNVEVLPVRLPPEMPIAVYNWDYALNDQYEDDLVRHRVNRHLVSCYNCLPECDDEGNVLKVDFSEHDRALHMASRPGGEVVYSYGVVLGFDIEVAQKHHWAYMSEPWKKAFRSWFTQWITHIRSLGYGYDDFCMQIWDEAYEEKANKVVQVGPLLRELDPRVRWVMDGTQDANDVRRMEPYIDIWIPHISALTNPDTGAATLAEYKRIQASGKPVWFYTCAPMMTMQPVNSYYRVKPWIVWDYGLDGVCYWAYSSWRGDSWSDFDTTGSESDNCVVYSSDESGSPVSSKRWEASREGLDDYLYLYLLKNTIAAGDRAGIPTSKGRSVLDQAPKEVVANSDDEGAVARMREEILQSLVQLQSALPNRGSVVLDWHDVEGSTVVECSSPESIGGMLFSKAADAAEWNTVQAAAVEGKWHVQIPSTRSGVSELLAVCWNKLGRMTLSPIMRLEHRVTDSAQ